MDKKLYKTIGFTALFVSMTGFAGTIGSVASEPQGTYLGAYGGGGTLSSISLTQLGTAFYSELFDGGPLAVDAFGQSNKPSEWIVGGYVGHYWSSMSVPFFSRLTFFPAAELEGFYIGPHRITGDDVNNGTTRLPEHLFSVTYPTKLGVGLVNAVINFVSPQYAAWRPYVGGGVGVAVVSIHNANSAQTAPVEAGVNHYNSDSSDADTALAAQAKAGLSFNYTEHLAIFAEYRYLYVGATSFTFGSTVYPAHVATSSWIAKFGEQSHNLGLAGIRLTA